MTIGLYSGLKFRCKTEEEEAFFMGIERIYHFVVSKLQERRAERLDKEARAQPEPPAKIPVPMIAPIGEPEWPSVPTSPKEGMYRRLLESAPDYDYVLFKK